MSAGVGAVLVAVVAAVVIGVAYRVRDGRIRARKTSDPGDVTDTVYHRLPEQLHDRLSASDAQVTLLQLSTTFCTPCRHARILLADFAQRTEGVRHVEVDLTDHPEWSTPLRVHRTPTTLVLDSAGRELFRIGGVPRRDALADALSPYLDHAR